MVETVNGPVRFQWSASGRALYVESTVNGVQNLWRAAVDTTTLDWRSVERLTIGGGSDVAAAISRDGRHLAYTQQNVATRVWAFPLEAATGRLLGGGRPITDDGATAEFSDLSPDGESIAHVLARPGAARKELWLTRIDRDVSELLASDALSPCWSPDGRELAYARVQRDREAVFVREMESGAERQLSPYSDRWLFPTSWTSDGRAIVVAALTIDKAELWLWSTKAGTTKAERVLVEQSTEQGRVSPNGKWLSFVPMLSGDPAQSRVAVAPAGGAPPESWRRIAPEYPWVDTPRWSPDGRLLYFVARSSGGFSNLFAVHFDAERGMPIGTPFPVTRFDNSSLAVSPFSGRTGLGISAHRVTLIMQTATGSIWMLDNVDK
jgi:Tol biopolymer transport system component